MPRSVLIVFWCFFAGIVRAADYSIPDAESLQPPSAARLAALTKAAAPDHWRLHVPVLRAIALRAYERGNLPVAEAWLRVYEWAALFALKEDEFVPPWINAIQSARVNHPNMPANYTVRDRALGLAVSPALQAWLVGNAEFSREFFEIISPLDSLPAVLEILNTIHQRTPEQFARYPSLALALAVVYDVPPPPWWPHAQVTPEALPRRWPAAANAFNWWVREDGAGQTYHRLARLGADELKFVIDAAAPFGELEQSQTITDFPLSHLDHAYTTVRYNKSRVANNRPIWSGKSYTLKAILADGGICVDQAYFATETAKARGVPSLLFAGAGSDGRHAWFGYLDGEQKWRMDVGRYAEQRFVTGIVLDPQTWRQISDHELQFLSERFRSALTFRQSQVHAAFAADFLRAGENAAAVSAARKAVNFEKRNLPAWELLASAEQGLGYDAKRREATLREAALAFQRYPDLEAGFVNRLCVSLRARGETSLAEAEETRIFRKNQRERSDLGAQQARETLVRSMSSQPLPEQVRVYNSLLDRYGGGAGIGFFDQVVVVFVEHLLREGERADALHALDRARGRLKIEPGSQLAEEMARLTQLARGK